MRSFFESAAPSFHTTKHIHRFRCRAPDRHVLQPCRNALAAVSRCDSGHWGGRFRQYIVGEWYLEKISSHAAAWLLMMLVTGAFNSDLIGRSSHPITLYADFANLVADEPADLQTGDCEQLPDRLGVVLDERLLDQDVLRKPRLDLALDDLLQDVAPACSCSSRRLPSVPWRSPSPWRPCRPAMSSRRPANGFLAVMCMQMSRSICASAAGAFDLEQHADRAVVMDVAAEQAGQAVTCARP